MMQDAAETRNQQRALWNGTAADAWISNRDLLDTAFRPFEAVLVKAIAARPGLRVLDVGCGTGATTMAIADRTGNAGRALGIDISAPMIEVARSRAAERGSTAEFLCADAEEHVLTPDAFDAVVSRFGVMFFGDPVPAFANLRRAARNGAALACVAWRSPADNPFMTTAERAAAPLLPELPPRRADGPGQFAWADSTKVAGILADGGWSGIIAEPLDVVCRFPAASLDRYILQLGPVGQFLKTADAGLKARVSEALRVAFAPYMDGDDIRFTAACWLVRAKAG
jgi:SAM-dependent methyltransferase